MAETLDGGQAFRWRRRPGGEWLGIWQNCVARLRLDGAGQVEWSAPLSIAATVEAELPRYLGAGIDFAAIADRLPWRNDPELDRCIQFFPTLRLLRQPFGETLLAFLCSAAKQIAQIKQMCEALAREFGQEISPGFFNLPSWRRLADIPETELRRCALGFRARYIKETAIALAEKTDWLDKVEQLPYPEAREALIALPGIGEKVADCVLLFGAGRMEAFPVDVWIMRSMQRRYGLDGWTNSRIAQFGRVHFGALAGYAQQFLFAHERLLAANAPPRSKSRH